jgi:hypothetical protein
MCIFNQNHSKSPISGDVFATQPPAAVSGSPTSVFTVLASENPSKIAEIGQKQLKSPVSEHFNWANDTESLPTTSIVPTKYPRDLSCLRSTATHPFLSLRRRRGRPKNQRNSYYPVYPWHHSLHPHNPLPASLNWDQDPRLADLGNALRALGWVRR